jgi:hypothetical protein
VLDHDLLKDDQVVPFTLRVGGTGQRLTGLQVHVFAP